jgi:hypothetical protein
MAGANHLHQRNGYRFTECMERLGFVYHQRLYFSLSRTKRTYHHQHHGEWRNGELVGCDRRAKLHRSSTSGGLCNMELFQYNRYNLQFWQPDMWN